MGSMTTATPEVKTKQSTEPVSAKPVVNGLTSLGIRVKERLNNEPGDTEYELLKLTTVGSVIQKVEMIAIDTNKFNVLIEAMKALGGVM